MRFPFSVPRVRRLSFLIIAGVVIAATGCGLTGAPAVPGPEKTDARLRQIATTARIPIYYLGGSFHGWPLSYTLPDGWKMFEDEPGQFGLALVANDRPCVCIWRDVRAAATTGAEEPEPGVGTSAKEITAWLAHHKWLKPTTPKAVTVGGLSGYMIDVVGNPKASTLIGSGISAGVH